MARTKSGRAHAAAVASDFNSKPPQKTRATRASQRNNSRDDGDDNTQLLSRKKARKGAVASSLSNQQSIIPATASDALNACSWAQFSSSCLFSAGTKGPDLLTCQYDGGCVNVCHHLCQITWQSSNNVPEGSISRYCPWHHPVASTMTASVTAASAASHITGSVTLAPTRPNNICDWNKHVKCMLTVVRLKTCEWEGGCTTAVHYACQKLWENRYESIYDSDSDSNSSDGRRNKLYCCIHHPAFEKVMSSFNHDVNEVIEEAVVINNVPVANIGLSDTIMEAGKDDDSNSIDSNEEELFLDVIEQGNLSDSDEDGEVSVVNVGED